MAGRERHHPILTLAVSTCAIAGGLPHGGPGIAMVLCGGGKGLFSIARGALPLAVFGADRYPALTGRLARPTLIAQAATLL